MYGFKVKQGIAHICIRQFRRVIYFCALTFYLLKVLKDPLEKKKKRLIKKAIA